MTTEQRERRRFQRIRLTPPIGGLAGGSRVFVVDISLDGARLAHQAPIPDVVELFFEWDGAPLMFKAEVLRTEVAKQGDKGKTIYQSGVEFLEIHPDSMSKLRDLIESYVARALDEQKANARGVPPSTTTYLKTAPKHAGYITCRLVGGNWKRAETSTGEQPLDGFTISASEDPEQIDLLCRSYEEANFEGRKLIRKLAALSVSSEDGVATRRFTP